MFVFCDKFCVRSDEYVSVIVKIKCVNSGNISDICNKLSLLQTTHTLQQYGYLVTEFSDEPHFVTQVSSLCDAIHLLSPIGLSW